jgi:hypothetical protein
MNVAARLEIERKIITKLMKEAIKQGYSVSVFDGEEYAVEQSTDIELLKKEIMATDTDSIELYHANGTMFGSVLAVYGNDGYDVMADSSNSPAFNEFLKPIEEYADKFCK